RRPGGAAARPPGIRSRPRSSARGRRPRVMTPWSPLARPAPGAPQNSTLISGPGEAKQRGRMATDFPFDEHLRFTAADDELHPAGPQRDWTETIWFSFAVPERTLAGWLYVQMRPNAGASSGG